MGDATVGGGDFVCECCSDKLTGSVVKLLVGESVDGGVSVVLFVDEGVLVEFCPEVVGGVVAGGFLLDVWKTGLDTGFGLELDETLGNVCVGANVVVGV